MDTWTPIYVYLNGERIEHYYSFIWTDRYNEPGDFELQLPYTDANAKKFTMDSIVTCNLSRSWMVVEETTVSILFDQGRLLIVKGRSIESVLDRRVVPDSLVLDSDDYEDNKFVRALTEICDSCFSSMVNVMTESNNFTPNNMVAIGGRELGISYISVPVDPENHIRDSEVRIEATGKDLLTLLEENCQLMGFGFRLRDGNTIEIYDGIDRSATIVYSEENDNLSSVEYSTDMKDYKNFAFVQGEEYSEHSSRITIDGVEYRESDLINNEFVANAVYKNNSNENLEIRLGPGFGYAVTSYVKPGESKTLMLKSGDWAKIDENHWVNMYLNGQLVMVKEENTYYSPVANYDPNPDGDEPVYYRAAVGTNDHGFDKRELYYDSGLDRGQNLNEKYTQRLRKAGILELTLNHRKKIQINCEVMHDTTKMYQQAFDLGDIVGIKFSPIIVNDEEGETETIDLIKMRVKEYTISHSPEGLDLYPTLEVFDPDYWETINESIKYQDDDTTGDYKAVKVYFMFGDGKITSTEGFNIVYGQDEWVPVWPPGYNFDDPENTDCADIIGIYKEQMTGDWIDEPDIAPTKENSVFDGWYNGTHKYTKRDPDEYEEEELERQADYIPINFDGDEIRYTARFDLKKYILTFNKGDHGRFAAPYANEDSIQKEYKYGTMPVPPAMSPVNDEEGVYYVQDGWDPELAVVTGDASYTAKWKEKPILYKITWNCGSWGAFTDEEHKRQRSYDEYIEHGSSITPPGVEAYNEHMSTGATWELDDPAWKPEIPDTALADGVYTAQWKKKDLEEIDQDPDEEDPEPPGDGITIKDKESSSDDMNRSEIPTLQLKHFKSYACKKGDKYNAINPPNQEDIVDPGGLPYPDDAPPYYDGDHWVKESWHQWASSPRLVADGEGQYFESEATIDLGRYWLVARFVNPPRAQAKSLEYLSNGKQSKGNALLNSQTNAFFCPIFAMSMYQKVEGSDELGGCLGIWWWRFGNGAKVAEVAFSTIPIFLPYRNYSRVEGVSGQGLIFKPGVYYVANKPQYSNKTYRRIWSKPSWWGKSSGESGYQEAYVYKRKRVGWYVGFLAQAYDDEGRRIDRTWSRTTSGDVVTLSNPYHAESQNQGGPWTVNNDMTVKQKWKMQLSYKYGVYYDGDRGTGDAVNNTNNTIKRRKSYVNPLSMIRNGSTSDMYYYVAYTGLTNDMQCVYLDSGIQFTPIPDSRFEASTSSAMNTYAINNGGISYLSQDGPNVNAPSNNVSGPKTDSSNLYGSNSTLIKRAGAEFPNHFSFEAGYVFGKKFQQYVDVNGTYGIHYTTYQELINRQYNYNYGYSIPHRWTLETVNGKLCRRYSGNNGTEADDEIGWFVGEHTTGESLDALIKITGSQSLMCNALKPMTDAYCQNYGDYAYFNALDTMISIFSEIGLDTQISFQWQVKEDHTYIANTSSTFNANQVYKKDGNTNNYIKLSTAPSDWATNYESYYRRSNTAQDWRNIEKDELYRGPIFDMRISSITDSEIGTYIGDPDREQKLQDFFGNMFGKSTEIFSGIKQEVNSFFSHVESLFKPVTSFVNKIEDKIDDLREAASDAVIDLVPDTTQMPTLRVKYNEQNAGYAYRCLITYTTDDDEETTYAPSSNGVRIYNTFNNTN